MKKLATLLAGLAVAAGANAATVSFTDSFGLATTNWTHLLGASQFNGALGTLNSALLPSPMTSFSASRLRTLALLLTR